LTQREKIVQVYASKLRLPGVLLGAGMGMLVLVIVLVVRLAMADGAVYLRTMMPFESFELSSPQTAPAADTDLDAAEQRLIERLYQEPGSRGSAVEVVRKDEQWRVVRMRVTAYCPCAICCGQFADGVTACNHRIQPGDVFVAADKMYRFRTDMIVPGYNDGQPVQVLDRGRVIKGNRLDVFFASHETARRWGTRYLDVLVREN
jgi:3D (Asp-Asp-Asp) domain-containing protein